MPSVWESSHSLEVTRKAPMSRGPCRMLLLASIALPFSLFFFEEWEDAPSKALDT